MLIATFLLSFRPTLKHQRPQEDKQKQFSSINEWYKKGTNLVSKELGIYKNLFPLDSSVMEMPRIYLIDHISNKNTWKNLLVFIACQIQKSHVTSPHLSSLCPVAHKAFTESLHLSRLTAMVFTSSHDYHPASTLSFSTVCLKVGF